MSNAMRKFYDESPASKNIVPTRNSPYVKIGNRGIPLAPSLYKRLNSLRVDTSKLIPVGEEICVTPRSRSTYKTLREDFITIGKSDIIKSLESNTGEGNPIIIMTTQQVAPNVKFTTIRPPIDETNYRQAIVSHAPGYALMFGSNGACISDLTSTAHELVHAYNTKRDKAGAEKLAATPDPQYTDAEHREICGEDGVERRMSALRHEGVREKYSGGGLFYRANIGEIEPLPGKVEDIVRSVQQLTGVAREKKLTELRLVREKP